MALRGMDVEAAQQFSRSLSLYADQISQAVSALSSELVSVQWVGSDGDRFRSDWDGSYRPQLSSIVSALQDRASHLALEAQAQLEASGQ